MLRSGDTRGEWSSRARGGEALLGTTPPRDPTSSVDMTKIKQTKKKPGMSGAGGRHRWSHIPTQAGLRGTERCWHPAQEPRPQRALGPQPPQAHPSHGQLLDFQRLWEWGRDEGLSHR